jgi:membrane-associated phospholipid phosphatase
MPTPYRYVLYTFPLVVIAVAVCMLWIDRPVALWMASIYSASEHRSFSGHIANFLTQLVYCLMVICFIWYFLLSVNRHNGYFSRGLLLFNESIAFTYFIKMTLQYAFGRYIPRYPEKSTLLFVHNPRLYGFHWFHAGCFPSGHSALLVAGLTAICLYYPRWKIPSVLLTLILAVTLLLLNYHFVSDIIGGAYLGLTVTLALYYLTKLEKEGAKT